MLGFHVIKYDVVGVLVANRSTDGASPGLTDNQYSGVTGYCGPLRRVKLMDSNDMEISAKTTATLYVISLKLRDPDFHCP